MPKRRQKTRKSHISDAIIEEMRAAIRAGHPWIREKVGERVTGWMDLRSLVTGIHLEIFCHFWTDTDDAETPAFLWSELRADILAEHAKRRPGTRPRAWWDFDTPKKTFKLIDKDDDDEGLDVIASQRAYLEAHGLLTPDEKALFDKYGDIIFVRVSCGDHGECEACWNKARKTANKIDFDLDGAVLPFYETFWIPKALFLKCTHERDGIFTPDD